MELRAYDVVVTLSVGKSQNYQKLRINYKTAMSCVSWVLIYAEHCTSCFMGSVPGSGCPN